MNIDLDVSMGMQMVCPGKFVLKQNGRNDDEAEETGTPREPDGEGSEVVGAKVRGVCAQPQLPRDKTREVQLEDTTLACILRAKEESISRPK